MVSGGGESRIRDRYVVQTRSIIAAGTYGPLYKAVDVKQKKDIAALCIDGEEYPGVFTENRDYLLKMEYENILKIYNFHKLNKKFWILMELQDGDLNSFFHGRSSTVHEKMEIMTGIAKGLAFLHSEDIKHGCVEPGHILISAGSPPVPKLVYLDHYKAPELDPMMWNTGCVAFKPPEFFKPIDENLIPIERNGDIFSMGLVFLAILQARSHTTRLVPRIETPLNDFEKHYPIGQIMAERIHYNVMKPRIVRLHENPRSEEEKTENFLRRLISTMTTSETFVCARPSVEDILLSLHKVKRNS